MSPNQQKHLKELYENNASTSRNNELQCSIWEQWASKYEILILQFWDDDRISVRRADNILVEIPEIEIVLTLNKIIADKSHLERSTQTVSSKSKTAGFTTVINSVNIKEVERILTDPRVTPQQKLPWINKGMQWIMPQIEETKDNQEQLLCVLNMAAVIFTEANKAVHAAGIARNREKLAKLQQEYTEGQTKSKIEIRKKKKSTSQTNGATTKKPEIQVKDFNKDFDKKDIKTMLVMKMNPNNPADCERFRAFKATL